jgi:hypothetical protein
VKVKALVFQARSSLLESRRASEISCQEIREELATAHGGALRRGPLRRHVRSCPGCAEFREQVTAQRKMLALALPVVPTLGLKHAVLASVGGGHAAAAGGVALGGGVAGGGVAGSGGVMTSAGGAASAGGVAAGGGVAGGGGFLSAIGAAGVAKVAAVAVVAAGGSAVAIDQVTKDRPAHSHTAPGAKGGAMVDTDGDGKPDTPASAVPGEADGKGAHGVAGTPASAQAKKAAAKARRKTRRREAAEGHHTANGHSALHRRDGKKDDGTSDPDSDTTTSTDDTAPGSSDSHRNDSGGHNGTPSETGTGSITHPSHPAHPVHPPPPPPPPPSTSSDNGNGQHLGQIKQSEP